MHGISQIYQQQSTFTVKSVVDNLKISMLRKQQQLVEQECRSKPKLRTFNTFKDFTSMPPHVGKPLSFIERKMLTRLRLGVLPLRIETARFVRPILPENQRICYCNSGEVESEYHLLFQCQKYSEQREAWFSKIDTPSNFLNFSVKEQLHIVLNEAKNVKHTAQYLVKVMDIRSLLNNSY